MNVMTADLEDIRRLTANEYPHGVTDAKMGHHQARRSALVDLDGSSDEHWDAEDLHDKRFFLLAERDPVSPPSPSDDGWSLMIMILDLLLRNVKGSSLVISRQIRRLPCFAIGTPSGPPSLQKMKNLAEDALSAYFARLKRHSAAGTCT